MNKADFKAGINSELKNYGFTENKLNTIVYGDEGTIIYFMQDVLPDSPLAVWLQNRFKWGVTILKNGVCLNNPNQDNKTPKLENTPTKSAEQITKEKAIQYVKDNWCDYTTADGGWDSAEGYQCFLAGHKLAKEENKKAIEMYDEFIRAINFAIEDISRGNEASAGLDLQRLIARVEQK